MCRLLYTIREWYLMMGAFAAIQEYFTAFIFLIAAAVWNTRGKEEARSENIVNVAYILIIFFVVNALRTVPETITAFFEAAMMLIVSLALMGKSMAELREFREKRTMDFTRLYYTPVETDEPKEDEEYYEEKKEEEKAILKTAGEEMLTFDKNEAERLKFEFAEQIVKPEIKKIEEKKKESQKELQKQKNELKKKEKSVEELRKEAERRQKRAETIVAPLKKKLKDEIENNKDARKSFEKKMRDLEDLDEDSQEKIEAIEND